MKKMGVVLSGCGVYDGAEIHENVMLWRLPYASGCLFAPENNKRM